MLAGVGCIAIMTAPVVDVRQAITDNAGERHMKSAHFFVVSAGAASDSI
jgi:hypothetical protein